jgi:hypothetical protein
LNPRLKLALSQFVRVKVAIVQASVEAMMKHDIQPHRFCHGRRSVLKQISAQIVDRHTSMRQMQKTTTDIVVGVSHHI